MSESDMPEQRAAVPDDLGPDVPRKVFDCGCLARGGKIVHARMSCDKHAEGQTVDMDSGEITNAPESP